MEPLAITGLGVVSPIAIGHSAWIEALRDPDRSKERAFGSATTVFTGDAAEGACVAEVWGFDATQYLGDKGLRNFDRLTKYMIVAAKLALEDAGLKKNGEWTGAQPEQAGIISATAYGSLDAITELHLVAEREDPRYINPARFPNTVINAAAGYVSIWEDLRAPNVTIVDGNCGALDAVLSCETHVRHRRGEIFLVGGGEVVSEPLYLALKKLDAIAVRGAKFAPGDPEGKGLRMSEGAIYAVVEAMDTARARAATVLGTFAGYGAAFDPPESEALLVHASSDSVSRAVGSAVRDAGLEPADIDLVVTSASGLGPMDAAEAQGLRHLFGERISLSAPKTILGETFGASGAVGFAVALAAIGGVTPPALSGGPLPARLDNIVVTAVGHYGNASAVVVRRA